MTIVRALSHGLFQSLDALQKRILTVILVITYNVADLMAVVDACRSLQLSRTDFCNRCHFTRIFIRLGHTPGNIVSRVHRVPKIKRTRTQMIRAMALSIPKLSSPTDKQLVSIPRATRPVLGSLCLQSKHCVRPNQSSRIVTDITFIQTGKLRLNSHVGTVVGNH